MAATGYVSSSGDTRKVSKAGDTMTGDLVLADSTPDTPTSATSKSYTDTTASASAAGAVAAHLDEDDPHGDRGAAASALSAHAGAGDAHGDRAWADDKFATKLDVSALNGAVNSLSSAVTNLDGFVSDCLTRVQNIETGAAFLAGGNFVGPVLIVADSLAAIRLHGMTGTPGAPSTGTWAPGDLVIDSAGVWHLCTAAGTPGSWT